MRGEEVAILCFKCKENQSVTIRIPYNSGILRVWLIDRQTVELEI